MTEPPRDSRSQIAESIEQVLAPRGVFESTSKTRTEFMDPIKLQKASFA